jgi:hypothetical protein
MILQLSNLRGFIFIGFLTPGLASLLPARLPHLESSGVSLGVIILRMFTFGLERLP